MKPYRPAILLTSMLLSAAAGALASGQDKGAPARDAGSEARICLADSVQISFRQSRWDLDRSVGSNAAVLDDIDRRLTTILNDSVCRVRSVSVYGGASPEGSIGFNKFLSERRAETLFGWFAKRSPLSGCGKSFTFYGRDWEGVLALAEKDASIPHRDETLALLRAIVSEKRALGGEEPAGSLERLKRLRGGAPYRHLYRHVFPAVRASKVVIEYDRVLAPGTQQARAAAREREAPKQKKITRDTVIVERVVVRDTVYIDLCAKGGRKSRKAADKP